MAKSFKARMMRAIKEPKRIILYLIFKGFLDFLPDKAYLQFIYRLRVGRKMDLKNPRSFNEKLQWLKLYDRKPIYTTMVDKYEAKKYVRDIIGEEYIIPTLGVWDRFEDIDFSQLPDQFVLKTTHDSGGVVICTDKQHFDIEAARKKLNRSLKRNYYLHGREWPYKDVRHRIIVEKYMADEQGLGLKDYKFMCFNGTVRCSFICSERFSDSGLKVTFFDREWNKMPFERHYPASDKNFDKPEQYEKMVEISEKLSKNIPFVRSDLYDIDGHIYFGELTFYPGSGMEEFTPEEWDYKLGEWIHLPVI